jgi:hypothetical protein
LIFYEMLNQKVLRLNFELSEIRTRTKIEIDEIKRVSKKEIKAWRKELGGERSKNIKLELKLKAALDKTVEEEKPLPVDAESSLASIPVEGALECSICAEPIHKYKPEYFNGIEMNPACDDCKTPSVEILTQSEVLGDAQPESPPKDEVEKLNNTEIEKARRKIHLKVKAKIEIRCRNVEISRTDKAVLEEELVTELEEELLKDFKEECERREQIT